MHEAIAEALKFAQTFHGDSHDFYEFWWSGARGPSVIPRSETAFHNPLLALRVGPFEGRVIAGLGTSLILIDQGEYLIESESKLRICRRSDWSNQHWNWIQGLRPAPFISTQEEFRIYIPSSDQDSNELSVAIRHSFDEEKIPFTMKYRLDQGTFKDCFVIWVTRDFLQAAMKIVQRETSKARFVEVPPPLTKRIGSVGLAEHPSDGSSLGAKFAELIWTLSKTVDQTRIEGALLAGGMNLDKPWILDATSSSRSWEQEIDHDF
jgi:hypothetical protein